MKLYLNKASPYARLVLVVAHEKALAEQLELCWIDPWSTPSELVAANPFSRVPTLVTDDAQPIVESVCICDYLDEMGGGRRLMPLDSPERLLARRKYGMGRGVMDTAFGVTIQRRYGESNDKSFLVERWLQALKRAIQYIEQDETIALVTDIPDMGDLAVAVALSYAEFRLRELDWRTAAPRLATRFDRVADRPSMRLSAPE